MPGAGHELISRAFFSQIIIRIASLAGGHPGYSVMGGGSMRFSVPGVRSKEVDESIIPSTRSPGQWPSLVIEMGYSESLSHLRIEAAWWLENSQGATRMVIIFRLKRDPNSIWIEVWKVVTNTSQVARARPPFSATCTHGWDIDEHGIVTPLVAPIIPYLTVFDTPHIGGRDIVFSADDLTTFAVHVFAMLPPC